MEACGQETVESSKPCHKDDIKMDLKNKCMGGSGLESSSLG